MTSSFLQQTRARRLCVSTASLLASLGSGGIASAAEAPAVVAKEMSRPAAPYASTAAPTAAKALFVTTATIRRSVGGEMLLPDTDLTTIERDLPQIATFRRGAFAASAPRPIYGPRPVANYTPVDNDLNRLTAFVLPVAATRVVATLPQGTPLPTATETPVAIDSDVRTEPLRAAIVEALRSNPEIQIALARQDDAKYGVNEAVAGYLPHIDVAVAIGNEFSDPQLGSSTMLRRGEGLLSVRQNVWDFGTTINDIKRARAGYRSAQWGTREKIEGISYDITAAYLSVLERQKLLALSEQSLAAHQKILKMVTTQNDLGLTTPADVSRAKARAENVQAQIQDRKSALEQAREAFRRLTDHLPGVATEVPSAAAALPASADAAVAMIADHSPRMAQAVQDRRSIERQRASQTGTFLPKLGLLAQANWRDDVQGRTGKNSDARVMFTVTYGFLNGGADVAVRNRLSARLREADYELERRRREVEQDLRIDFNALEAARTKTATIESEIASSEKVAQLYTQQFREGRRTVFDLLDSQQSLFDARANLVSNGTAKQLAEFRVLQKLGGLFDLLSEGQKLPKLAVPAAEQAKRAD
ncbi:TolC family protein [uncultured Sphingomonas sp.]|uniref:TolC family protein n=1 Tax=uncultured Sphingomonas sp. TaxID=158754 RepID=UPI0035CBCB61